MGISYGFPGAALGAGEAGEIPSLSLPPLDAEREREYSVPAGEWEDPPLTPLPDLLAEPNPELRWLVDGLLLAGGISLLAAKPKVGKSTLARTLAVAVGRGAPFLGRATLPGPVLYLALEEHRSGVIRHFLDMGAAQEPVYVYVGSAPEAALAWLERAIGRYRPALAIIDPIFKLLRLGDGNDYAQVSRAFEPVISLARQHGCHVLCVHHLGKSDRGGGDAILGSTALFGAVDTALLLKRQETTRLVTAIQRYGTDLPETAIGLDTASGSVRVTGETARLVETDVRERVLALCTTPLPEAELLARVSGNRVVASTVLRQLVEEGALVRSGDGRRAHPYLYHCPEYSLSLCAPKLDFVHGGQAAAACITRARSA